MTPPPPILYIDADACPVKEEAYRVARRYGLKVFLVANTWVRPPPDRLADGAPMAEAVTVDQGPDVADDWIAQRCGPRDVVVTSDIPLASRCLAAGATVLRPTGRPFDVASIGMALAGAPQRLRRGCAERGSRFRPRRSARLRRAPPLRLRRYSPVCDGGDEALSRAPRADTALARGRRCSPGRAGPGAAA